MQVTSFMRQHARALTGATLLLGLGAAANATDSYSGATHQATVPSVSVGSVTLSNVVATVGSIVTPPSGTSANGPIDSYDPITKQLTVQSVTVGSSTYYNAVVTLTPATATVGGATGSDSYANGQLTLQSIKVGQSVFTNVVINVALSDVTGVGGGLPASTADSYSNGVLTLPVVTALGHVYTNVTLAIASPSIVSIGGRQAAPTGVLSTGFDSAGVSTTSSSAKGTWAAYFGGSNNAVAGGNGGGYADQGVSPSYEYQYISDTIANLGTYVYEGVGIQPAAGQVVSGAGFNALSFSLAVNPEWLQGGANFVVLLTSNVPGVSNSGCDPTLAAVVTATSAGATPYTIPVTAFTNIRQNCGNTAVTPAQIVAGSITSIDFQAVGGTAAITASGLTTTFNTTVLNGTTYPTTVNVVGGVSFVTVGGPPPAATTVLSTGFNSTGTTTTSTSSTGTWATYFGGSNAALAGGAGGGYADQGTSPSYEYQYINDTLANLGAYTYEGVGITAATDQTVSTAGTNNISFTLAVNPEWFQAGANFVILITTNVAGVSNPTCNPKVAAVVTATASSATAYSVPLSAFTFAAQNCGIGSLTPAQVLAGNVVGVDFQADGLGSALTASGLKSNSNTTVAAAGTYPTTVNVVGGVSFTQ